MPTHDEKKSHKKEEVIQMISISQQDILLHKLVAIYLEYYKIKEDFREGRALFLDKALREKGKKGSNKEEGERTEEEITQEIITEEEYIKDDEKEGKLNEKEGNDSDTKTSALYHKLALKLHPDKNKNTDSLLFTIAEDAKTKYSKLLFLSKYVGLGVDSSLIDEKKIEEAIQKKEAKIRHYEKTYPIQYIRAKDEGLKEKILASFLGL